MYIDALDPDRAPNATDPDPLNAPELLAEIVVPHDDPSGLTTHTVASPVWIEGSEKTAPRPALATGQHTDEILAGLGRTPEDIAAPRACGAVA